MPQVTFILNGQDTSTLYEEGMNFLEVLRRPEGRAAGLADVFDHAADS